jgi:hypothetical protein
MIQATSFSGQLEEDLLETSLCHSPPVDQLPPMLHFFLKEECQKPIFAKDGVILGWAPFGRYVLNQDTGGAIRGPGRVDLFWGGGPFGRIAAGHLKHSGALYFLLLKEE